MQNLNYVHGRLRIEGSDDVFETMELAVPQDRFSYIKHCLPPGEYAMEVQQSLVALGNGSVRKPWPSLVKVRWFPKAGIYTNFDDHSLLSGRIFIGVSSKDEWSVEQSDVTTAKIIAAMQSIYDYESDMVVEPVTLVISELPDMEVHHYTHEQYLRELEAERELQAKKEAELRLQRLIDGCEDVVI